MEAPPRPLRNGLEFFFKETIWPKKAGKSWNTAPYARGYSIFLVWPCRTLDLIHPFYPI